MFGHDHAARREAVEMALDVLDKHTPDGPYAGASPAALAALVDGVEPLPEEGQPLAEVLAALGGLAVANSVDPADPACAAHLQCPPLNVALAADLLVSATNPSLDSWDQAPVATHLEPRVVAALARLAGLPPEADGVFTSGGTQSNLMGLLLARDRALPGRDVAAQGLGADGARLRLLCSAEGHFSVRRSAALLGLGSDAVVTVATDAQGRMDPAALGAALVRLADEGLTAAAVVATAGTTDLGAIDPLPAIAERARGAGAWLHVDAAYGGALLFSQRHRGLLDGLAAADSVALDAHKLLWQPVACGVLLVRDRALLAPIDVEVAYLNPADGDAGAWRMPHLLSRSLATTRRFDALKLLLTCATLGRRGLGELVDTTLALAQQAADLIDADPHLELLRRPTLSTVLFRAGADDARNKALRLRLLADGRAVVGQTTHDGAVWLKLTLLNPSATPGDLAALVDGIAATARALCGA